MSHEEPVSAETCTEIRRQHSFSEGIEPLRDRFDIAPQELRAHLYGDCAHEVDISPITPPAEKRVSSEECAAYRKKATDNSIVEIAETAEQTRQTVARHAFGRCSHDIDTPAADPVEGVADERLEEDECAGLRARYRDSDYESVLDFSPQYDVRYETVLKHLRGKCGHDPAEPPVEGHSRAAAEIAEETCREMREAWRDDADIGFGDIAEEFSVSVGTAERHIKFHCHHDYETVRAEEMDLFAEYFDDGGTETA